MAEANIEDGMRNLNFKSDINILLLGASGVGKSTLINAFANYLTFKDLKAAKKDKLMVLIPSQFTVTDKDENVHSITTGNSDNNEYLQIGESATQDVKTYVFPIWDGATKIRLIDTPGMIDNRGIDQDDINCENILRYIANIHELHAICFLLKANEARYTVFFQYCMNQIFSRLDKSACDNIIFCFTHTRGSDYGAGETIKILEKAVDEIASRPPYAKIPLKRNIFYFDNEPFKYLAAVAKGINFESRIKERNKESWEKSAEQSWKLIKYITGDSNNRPLRPHYVKSTNAINEARRMIIQLSQPLAEITQLIHHNMCVLERHNETLNHESSSLEELRSKLYMPVIALEVTNLTQPVTVCAARRCIEVYNVSGQNVSHYKQRCHDPCYLTNVPKEIIGATELLSCAAMNGTSTCTKCMCDFKVHMHVYYLSKTVEKQEVDENIQRNISSREDLIKKKQQVIQKIEIKHRELHNEHQIVVEACAKFAHFLQNNAITPFSDSYKEYIEYLINREKSLGKQCNKETVKHLEKLLLQYVEIKKRFDEALKGNKAIGKDSVISPTEIHDAINKLYALKHNGQKIKELYNCQKNSRTKEFKNTEYVHKMSCKPKEDKTAEKKKKDQKQKTEKDDQSTKNKNDRDRSRNRQSKKGDGNRSNRRNRTPPPNYNEATNRRHQNHNLPNQSFPPPLMSQNAFGGPQGNGSPDWSAQGNPSQWSMNNPSGVASGPPQPEYDIKITVKNNKDDNNAAKAFNSIPHNRPLNQFNQQFCPPGNWPGQQPWNANQPPANWTQQPPANWSQQPPANWPQQPPANWLAQLPWNYTQPPANWTPYPPANWMQFPPANSFQNHRGSWNQQRGSRNNHQGRDNTNRGRGGVHKNKTGSKGKNNEPKKVDNKKNKSKKDKSSSSSDSSRSDSD